MSVPFVAEIRMFGFNFPPRGWAQCDGQIIPISQNTVLFALIGTFYGGNGSTTFALPDLRGRAPLHSGSQQGPGLTQRSLGEQGGVATVALTSNEIPSHNHGIRAINALGTTTSPTGQYPARDNAFTREYVPNASQNTNFAASAIQNSGGGQGHENRQPYLAVNFCIALTGIFPPRD